MKNIISIIIILLLASASVWGQSSNTVVAVVVNANNKPMKGVCVRQKSDRSNFTFTDASGRFSLTMEQGEPIELSLNNGDRLVVVPQENKNIVFDLRASDVEYGFGIRYNLLESTASVSTVSGDKLEQTRTLSPENSLYGMLPGLMVMQNGNYPWLGGSYPSFFIRGRGTNQNSGILALVDGVERPLIALSLGDIESVSVLKDAATLALFGQRGANGILNVKTKRGRYNSNEVRINYQHGLTFPISLPNMVNGPTYARALNEARKNDGLLTPAFSDYDIANITDGTYPHLLPNVDWFKETLRSNGLQDALSVSFRGGSNVVAYYSMVEINNEQGLYRPVNLNDTYSTQLTGTVFNVSNKLDIHLTKTTDFSVNMTANIFNISSPGGLSHSAIFDLLYQLPPTAMPIYAEDGSWGGNPFYVADNLSSNPIAQIANRGYVSGHLRRLAVDGTLTQDLGMLIRGLSADVRLSYDNMAEYADLRRINNFRYTTYTWHRDPVTNTIPKENVTATINGADALLTSSSGFVGQWRHSLFQSKLNYEFQKGAHAFNAAAIYYQEKFIGNGQYNTFIHQSGLGQAHYVYKQRYVADLAFSYSGSNYLAPGDRFRFYPAISAAWIISNESFMHGNDIDFLKMRASYGLSGNDKIDQNLFMQGFTQGGGVPFKEANTNIPGRIEGKMATDKVSPECAYTANFGFDFSFWKKFSGSLDLFYSHRTQIMAESDNTTSGILGVSAPTICTGIVDNRGFETGISWNDKIGGISYTLGAQFSYARNKIVNMEEQFRLWDDTKRTGRRVGQPFGLKSNGYFNSTDEVNNAIPQSWGTLRPGDVRYLDHNGDGVVNSEDEQPLASPVGYPGMYFSFNLGIEWKGLGFSALIQGAADYGVNLNTMGLYRGLIDNSTLSQYMYDNAWSGERSTSALYPRLTSERNDNNFRNNDIWVIQNPFVKLRHIQVYYHLPKRWISKVKLDDLSIFLNGNNVLSIDRLPVSDPEFIGAGYPLLATYTLGVNFKF